MLCINNSLIIYDPYVVPRTEELRIPSLLSTETDDPGERNGNKCVIGGGSYGRWTNLRWYKLRVEEVLRKDMIITSDEIEERVTRHHKCLRNNLHLSVLKA